MSVRRLLVTGTDAQLLDFHLAVCLALNAIERRGNTIAYTCMAESWDEAILVAKKVGATVQEIHGAGDSETYELICGDNPWKPKKSTK